MKYDHNDIRVRVEATFRLRGNANPSASIIEDVIEIVQSVPVPMRLHCPVCHMLHIDDGEFATKAHRDHACQHCGMVWRPALVPTVGVQFLPGYKNGDPET